MKYINSANKKLIFLLVIVFALFSITGCAKKIQFQRSAVVPAADGKVKVKKDGNNNYSVGVSVEHLAPAKNLSPAKDTYIVWMESDDHGTQNIGQLKSSTGFLSSTFKGSISTVTPYKPKRIYITGENDP
ncbi:MAG: hypothetical protein ABIO82_02465, partial [Ginsengibacter sp.]